MSVNANELSEDFFDSQMHLNELYQSVQQKIGGVQGTAGNATLGAGHVASTAQSIGSAGVSRVNAQSPSVSDEELARIFNSAVISTRTPSNSSLSTELMELAHSPAYRAVLIAVRHHAADMGVSEKVAAEQIIQTFRKLERTWLDYVFQEGLERIKSSG
jgi:hypothetical protein